MIERDAQAREVYVDNNGLEVSLTVILMWT